MRKNYKMVPWLEMVTGKCEQIEEVIGIAPWDGGKESLNKLYGQGTGTLSF